MIQELKKYNFKNLKVWNRGVDTKLFDPNKRDRADKNLQLTYVGRVAIEKNIEAFLNLKGDYIKTVVGDGPELQKYIKKYPEVNFVGLKEGGGLQWLTFEFGVPLAMAFLMIAIVPTLYKSGVVSVYAVSYTHLTLPTNA